jgi:DNA-binding transcriptional ArsR family regulator
VSNGRPKRAAKLDDATRMAKALAHPLRARALARLNEVVASPNELAQEFGEPLGNVSYHVRALLDLECIELVDTAPRRGAVEHYYRATRPALVQDDAWQRLPPTARRGFAVQWFKETFADVTSAVDGGAFETERDHHMSFTTLRLDQAGWEQLHRRLNEVVEEAMRLQDESADRAPGSADEIACRLVLAHYAAPPADEGAGEPAGRSRPRHAP